MPRGVPKSGFRLTKNRMAAAAANPSLFTSMPVLPARVETVEEIEKKLKIRFDALATMTKATAMGVNRGMIVSGPAGLGKSFTVEDILKGRDRVTYVKGYVRPMALYELLYNARSKNSVIVFDDSDSVFGDDVSLNLLKGAMDTTDKRILSWLSQSLDRMEGDVPSEFEFEGGIIFITNMDFDAMIATGNKMAAHFQALISRCHYIDLAMKTKMDYLVRIKQVVNAGMLAARGFNKSEVIQIIDFIEHNVENLRELSLRMVIKISDLFRMEDKWQELASITCFRNK